MSVLLFNITALHLLAVQKGKNKENIFLFLCLLH